MDLGKKLKAIRLEEGLNQAEFAELIELSISTVRSYEQGVNSPEGKNLQKIAKNKRLKKYAYWLISDDTIPESGQICPAFSTQERCGLISLTDVKRA